MNIKFADREWEVFLVNDGTMDTLIILKANGVSKEYRFDSEFAFMFRKIDGSITSKGLKEIAESTIEEMDNEDYNKFWGETIERDGFTLIGSKETGYHVSCSQCQANTINGVATHETGCPNSRRASKDYDEESNDNPKSEWEVSVGNIGNIIRENPSNRSLAQLFAQGATSGKAFCNTFIEGNTIYSYGHHFPIATRHASEKIAYINAGRYSMTTSKQTGAVAGALAIAGYHTILSDRFDASGVLPPSPEFIQERDRAKAVEAVRSQKRMRAKTDRLGAMAGLKPGQLPNPLENPIRAGVQLPENIAVRLLEWHGGQDTSTYSLGSSSLAGKAVPARIAVDAVSELRSLSDKEAYRLADYIEKFIKAQVRYRQFPLKTREIRSPHSTGIRYSEIEPLRNPRRSKGSGRFSVKCRDCNRPGTHLFATTDPHEQIHLCPIHAKKQKPGKIDKGRLNPPMTLIGRKCLEIKMSGGFCEGNFGSAYGMADGSAFIKGIFTKVPGGRVKAIVYLDEAKAEREGLTPASRPWKHDFSSLDAKAVRVKGGLIIKSKTRLWENR